MADLQIQTRDYAGYRTSRQKLMKERSDNTAFWLGFVVAAFLDKKYDLCVDIITTYRSATKPTPSYIHQELFFIEAECYAQKKEFSKAADTVASGMAFILDEDKAREKEALYRGLSGDLQKSCALWERLVQSNGEDSLYLRGIECCELGEFDHITDMTEWPLAQQQKLVSLYDKLANRFPRSLAIRHRRMALLHGESCRAALEEELSRGVRKGVPSLFRSLRDVLQDSDKFAMAKAIAEKLLQNCEREEPQMELWLLLFLAEMEDAEQNGEKALEYLQRAYDHTPTCYDLYLIKAHVLKHMGALKSAARTIGEGSLLDLGDRYLNTKHVKYLLRAGDIEEADKTVSYWTRQNVPCRVELNLLQACWYELECADAYYSKHDLPHALKLYFAVLDHFTTFVQDQFDFHQYVLRKGILTTYIDWMQKIDTIYKHKYYQHAAEGAIRIVLELHEHPFDVSQYKKHNKLTLPLVHKKGAEYPDDEDPDGLKLISSANPLDLVNDVISELLVYSKHDPDAMMLVAQWAEMKKDQSVYQKAVSNTPCIEAWLQMDEDKADMSQYHVHVMMADQMLRSGKPIDDILLRDVKNGSLGDVIHAYRLLKECESERLEEFISLAMINYKGFKELVDYYVCSNNSAELVIIDRCCVIIIPQLIIFSLH